VIRKAVETDKEFVSMMHYIAGPSLFKYFFSCSERSALKLISDLFKTKDTIFAGNYMYVLEDMEITKGAMVLLPGCKVKPFENNILKYSLSIIKNIGLHNYPVMLYRSLYAKCFPKIFATELFIHAIGVGGEYRGQYVGGKLLNFAFAQAKELGYDSVSLYVEIENARALNVYQKNGFDIVETVSFRETLKKNGMVGLYKMIRKI
jgi:GNAT superfamily N-acetyltransferase